MLKYIKLDMTHPDYADALEACRQAFVLERPANEFAVNANAAGTECWVKTTTAAGLEDSEAVLDEAPLHDHARVAAECGTEEWIGAERLERRRGTGGPA